MAENNKINTEELEEVTGGTSALFNDTIDTKPEKKAQGRQYSRWLKSRIRPSERSKDYLRKEKTEQRFDTQNMNYLSAGHLGLRFLRIS